MAGKINFVLVHAVYIDDSDEEQIPFTDEEIFTFECERCHKETSYEDGGDGDELCNDCWSASNEN